MEKVTLTIDNIKVSVPKGYTILEAAKEANIDIPTLCYLKEVNEVGACRMCVVEVKGARSLQAACVHPVSDGMEVRTNSKKVRDARKSTLELILSNHNRECLTCVRNKTCELQSLSEELGIRHIPYGEAKVEGTIDSISHSIVRDSSKCILCGRCVNTCKKVQEIGILDFVNRGFNTEVAPAFNVSMMDSPCIYCGQCIVACPVAALREKDDIEKVWDALSDEDTFVVAQTAPAVRAALGEEFGYDIGTRVTGKMAAALKRLGFHRVFDTNFAADLTIMEEGHELLARIKNKGVLPMITSCSPGWIRYCEFNHPDMLKNLSTCKSPHQMMGAIVKSYFANNKGIDPKKIFVVSIMPCTSKKTEAMRDEMNVNGLRDVDVVLTTRELGRMIKQGRIDFRNLEDEIFDQDLLGEYSGAGVIFGATGGVMEAALRTVAEVLEEKPLEDINFTAVRGVEDIKEAKLKLGGIDVKVAVAHGTKTADKLLQMVKSGEKEYDFIEIMGCSGGCVTGGGQPHVPSKKLMDTDVRVERAKALYEEDKILPVRKSHENTMIKKLYEDFLEHPNSHKAHELLHTHYYKREKYPKDKVKK
ncbi:MAG: NADH-dependent [FeFe] hydrogenase, group A6 [Anaeromicrobium sp.]|jgi:NADH-quinone oxidoreductase subunit G/NADP-reducing hydrogenase subunit HndD|uniref:NADH-dependent [FeFe] hydrogenase, group A6 n=1 Tax=Anaeromicrobium sp. TaxID=1929132 RepID=UPI0025D12C3E|nr:NADH-dependent [FeFe] hydrogenase, group A6 [Anaeromicrobium sp.]MCT4595776.1 NADH-dependent [FeFe] hydrogenase, group A6 [Anaeromicrobium sp.]